MRNTYGEARIILIDEAAGADERDLPRIRAANETVRTELAKSFGGWTETPGRGGWVDGHGNLHTDHVIIIDVAVPAFLPVSVAGGIVRHETERAWLHATGVLIDLARIYCGAAGQQCVYLRTPDGSVLLIDRCGRNVNDGQPPAHPHADHFWAARAYRAPR